MATLQPEQSHSDLFLTPGDPQLDAQAKEILTRYSGVPPERIAAHVRSIRDKAWLQHPYPCIGMYKFMDFGIVNAAQYPTVIHRLIRGDKLLDLGCCFGHVLRRLVYDGAPSQNLAGMDIVGDFLNLGYDLFQDRDEFKADLRVGDILEPKSSGFETGSFDIIYAGAFFHGFTRDEQIEALRNTVRLLKPKAGSMIFGGQTGVEVAGPLKHTNTRSGEMYRNSPQTFKELAAKVAEKLGLNLACDVEPLGIIQGLKEDGNNWRLLKFCITVQ